jgi:hypothetical protein
MENKSGLISFRLDKAGNGFCSPADKKPLKRNEKGKSDDLKTGVREKAEVGKNYLRKFSVNQRGERRRQIDVEHRFVIMKLYPEKNVMPEKRAFIADTVGKCIRHKFLCRQITQVKRG